MAWGALGTFTAVGPAHLITITPNASAPYAFYRVRLQLDLHFSQFDSVNALAYR